MKANLVLPSWVTWVKFISLSELQKGLWGGLNKIMFVKCLALHILASFHFSEKKKRRMEGVKKENGDLFQGQTNMPNGHQKCKIVFLQAPE